MWFWQWPCAQILLSCFDTEENWRRKKLRNLIKLGWCRVRRKPDSLALEHVLRTTTLNRGLARKWQVPPKRHISSVSENHWHDWEFYRVRWVIYTVSYFWFPIWSSVSSYLFLFSWIFPFSFQYLRFFTFINQKRPSSKELTAQNEKG